MRLWIALITALLFCIPPADCAARVDYKSKRGTPPCLKWEDSDLPAKGVLLCVHGCGLHNGTYKDFALEMVKRGMIVYAVDVRGFGSYQKAAGRETIDLDGCVWDVEETLRVIKKVHKDLPIYLIGESMGGAIALRAASRHPELLNGLIASVPAGDRQHETMVNAKVALRALLGPSRQFGIGSTIVNQSTNQVALKKVWSEDPLARMHLSPLELLQFDRFCAHNVANAKQVKSLPVLYLQGSKDQLIKPESTLKIYHNTASADKWLLQIGGQEHLILEENQFNSTIVDLIGQWIEHPSPKKDAVDPASVTSALKAKG